MKRTHLVIVDPQMDFCTPPGTYPGVKTGAMFVPGADQDMKRLAAMVKRISPVLADIHIALDNHHLMDVAHPPFWKNAKGQNPGPFTLITASDLHTGVWTTTIPSFFPRMLKYVEALERGGRYWLTIWPAHCLIGTPGAAIVPELMEAVNGWEISRRATVDFITKGSNIFVEHYSAIRAEIPDRKDPTTMPNTDFVETIEHADLVLWAGEPATQGFANTIRDAVDLMRPAAIKKMVLLTDAASAVPGFEKDYKAFMGEMVERGMHTSTTTGWIAG